MLLTLAERVRDDIARRRHIVVLDRGGRRLELAGHRRLLVIGRIIISIVRLDLIC